MKAPVNGKVLQEPVGGPDGDGVDGADGADGVPVLPSLQAVSEALFDSSEDYHQIQSKQLWRPY